jgi:Domain of unknown function (DUF4105)
MRRAPLAVVVLVFSVVFARWARADTRVELYTMGTGNDLFEAFGHGALCVTDEQFPNGACYNYGTADFRDPAALVWQFLRGRAKFWASRMPLPLMLQAYTEQDRTIYRQAIPLPNERAVALAAALETDVLPENKFYQYNHYRDNCTTRLRDHLDRATGGLLGVGSDVLTGQTWRDVTLRGFAIDVRLLIGMEFLVGWQVDSKMTLWDAMFLPDVLRAEVQKRLHADVEVVNVRKQSLPPTAPLAGRWLVFAGAGALTILVAFAALLGRPRLWRFVLALSGLLLGAIGLVVYGTALIALMTELRRNEVLLVCLPTDLFLLVLRRRPLWVYLVARVVGLAAVAIGLGVGILIQPIGAALALVAGPLGVVAVRELQNARRLPVTEEPFGGLT